MCLYPTLIKNRKYLPNKKNGGYPPKPQDPRVKYVAIGCGNCIECRRQKANWWRVRLERELEARKQQGIFVTLTFSPESIDYLTKKCKEDYENEEIFEELTENEKINKIAKKAVKLFRERWRKKYGKSIHHWLITERGHHGTQRLHLHGILFTNEKKETVENIWSYGWTYQGTYCNKKTINYIIKYVTKLDTIHTGYKQIICASPGIGDNNYKHSTEGRRARYRGRKTEERYRTQTGQYLGIPMYLRNKIYTEKQRELLWIYKLDQQIRWVRGIEIDVSTEKGEKRYQAVLETAQRENTTLGYGKREFDFKEYKKQCQLLKWKNIEFNKIVDNFEKNIFAD